MISLRTQNRSGLLELLLILFFPLSSPAWAAPPLLAGAAALPITPADEQGRLWQEPYEDLNGNGRYDAPDPAFPKRRGEPFTDLNGNGKWDGPFLAGFLHRGPYYTAAGVHDPLWARALVLEQGETTLAIVALDVVGFSYPDVLRIREGVADLGLTQVIVASTHTHGGVDTLGLWGPNFSTDGKDPRTIAWIIAQSGRAIRQAWAARRPARLTWGKGRPLSRFGALINDLRDPVVIDDELRVMRAEDLDGKTIAALVNWSPHPETSGGISAYLTSDFPHYLRKGIEEGGFSVGGKRATGLGGIAIYVSGSVGGLLTPLKVSVLDDDQEPIPERSWAKVQRIGELAAWTALEALRTPASPPIVRIELRSRTLFVPFDNLFLRGLYDKGLFQRETYRDGKAAGKEGTDLLTEVDLINFYTAQGIFAQLATLPGEPFPELSLGGHLKEKKRCWAYTDRKRKLGGNGKERIGPAHPEIPPEPALGEKMAGEYRFILGLGNDELGYIVPANDFVPPQLKPSLRYGTDRCGDDDHYEEIVSAGSQMAPRVVAALMALLKGDEELRKAETEETILNPSLVRRGEGR